MTPNNFKKYCRKNELIKIVPTKYRIDFFFKRGKRVMAYSGMDGIVYAVWKKPKDRASNQLVADLGALIPQMKKQYEEKYGSDSFFLAAAMLATNSMK